MDKEKYNKYLAEYMKRRYIKLKLDAIAYKGGKCMLCGYNKCYGALVFHHRDPTLKELDWAYLKKRSWSIIKTELDKCDLLCKRCHAELHHNGTLAEEAIKWLENKKRPESIVGTGGNCMVCGKEFIRDKWDKHKKYCSPKCSNKAQERTNWPSDDEFLVLISCSTQTKLGTLFNVSPRCIKKRFDSICARQASLLRHPL